MKLKITRYAVEKEKREYSLEKCGPDLWAIRDGPYCLSNEYDWIFEPSPSNRDMEFLASHRFLLEKAVEMLLML